jgi:CubicO group peptidase (beta-lactamase class C family)
VAFLDDWRASGEVTAAVAALADDAADGVLATAGAGHGDRFDLASITKPFIATLALVLDRQAILPLSTLCGEAVVGAAAPSGLRVQPLEALLRHRSGLAPWLPLSLLVGDPQDRAGLVAAASATFDAGRRGQVVYSDLGYLLWGWSVEKLLGERLDALLRRWVLMPLGIDATVAFAPLEAARVAPDGVVPTLCDGAKESGLAFDLGHALPVAPPPPPGFAQDGNARWLGQPCGHAGLFGRVSDVLALAEEWRRPRLVLDGGDTRRALAESGEPGYSLGWARRWAGSQGGGGGSGLSPGSFGQTAFSGGNVWVDPRVGRSYVLLAHRSSSLSDLNPRRRAFHELFVS